MVNTWLSPWLALSSSYKRRNKSQDIFDSLEWHCQYTHTMHCNDMREYLILRVSSWDLWNILTKTLSAHCTNVLSRVLIGHLYSDSRPIERLTCERKSTVNCWLKGWGYFHVKLTLVLCWCITPTLKNCNISNVEPIGAWQQLEAQQWTYRTKFSLWGRHMRTVILRRRLKRRICQQCLGCPGSWGCWSSSILFQSPGMDRIRHWISISGQRPRFWPVL